MSNFKYHPTLNQKLAFNGGGYIIKKGCAFLVKTKTGFRILSEKPIKLPKYKYKRLPTAMTALASL